MAKAKVLLPTLILLALANVFLICIAGCNACMFNSECSDEYSGEFPAYANKSGETVRMVAIIEGFYQNGDTSKECDIFPYCYTVEKLIADSDTLHNYPTEEWNALWLIGCQGSNCRDRRIRMELHFQSEPEKCLVFDGPIEDDGFDMRSWESYKKGKLLENGVLSAIEYVYTITTEHKAMAKEEFCDYRGFPSI